ncbi:hypothetical protein SPAN111604_09140 [Sphingomonas antarctica]
MRKHDIVLGAAVLTVGLLLGWAMGHNEDPHFVRVPDPHVGEDPDPRHKKPDDN